MDKGVADSVTGEPLGNKIRKRRRAIDMTLQQVAERVGLSISFLSQIERGLSTPSLSSLCNIAEVLGTSVDAFVKAPLQSGAVSRQGERELLSLATPGELTNCWDAAFRGEPSCTPRWCGARLAMYRS